MDETSLVEELERAADAHVDVATERAEAGRLIDAEVHRARADRLRSRVTKLKDYLTVLRAEVEGTSGGHPYGKGIRDRLAAIEHVAGPNLKVKTT